MAIEKVFVVHERVVVTQFYDSLVAVAVPKSAEPGVREPFERPPQHLVTNATHIDANSTVESFAPHDHERLWRQRRHAPRVKLVMESGSLTISVGHRGRQEVDSQFVAGAQFFIIVPFRFTAGYESTTTSRSHRWPDGRHVRCTDGKVVGVTAAASGQLTRPFRSGRTATVVPGRRPIPSSTVVAVMIRSGGQCGRRAVAGWCRSRWKACRSGSGSSSTDWRC